MRVREDYKEEGTIIGELRLRMERGEQEAKRKYWERRRDNVLIWKSPSCS